MDDPVFPKLPEPIVECFEDPITEIWAKSDENWAFYGHLTGLRARDSNQGPRKVQNPM